MIERVCLITNYNLYESKRHFTEKFKEALERHSIKTLVIDTDENALDIKTARDIIRFQPNFTCSFNTLNPINQDQFLWDLLKIPHLSFLVDPAFYSINLINSPYSLISCVDKEDVNSIQAEGFRNCFFLPHAVEQDLFHQKRQAKVYEAVFIGTCYDNEGLEAFWKKKLSLPLQRVLVEAIEVFESSPSKNLEQALKEAWNHSSLTPDSENILTLFHLLDSYTRGKDRVQLIRSLKNVNIHVFGSLSQDVPGSTKGWKGYLEDLPNIVVHDPLNFSQTFEILQKSKFCLNSMPFFKNGSHERIFNGLACGSVPITTENTYIREQFKENEEIFFYFKEVSEQTLQMIQDLIADEEKRLEMLTKGQKVVLENHTWDQRAKQLIQILPNQLDRIHRLNNPFQKGQ